MRNGRRKPKTTTEGFAHPKPWKKYAVACQTLPLTLALHSFCQVASAGQAIPPQQEMLTSEPETENTERIFVNFALNYAGWHTLNVQTPHAKGLPTPNSTRPCWPAKHLNPKRVVPHAQTPKRKFCCLEDPKPEKEWSAQTQNPNRRSCCAHPKP